MREYFCDYSDGMVYLTGFSVILCTVRNSCHKMDCPYKKGLAMTGDDE